MRRHWLAVMGGGAAVMGGGAVGAMFFTDTFTTARITGAVNGTPAEPGPSSEIRYVQDTYNEMTISGGKLVVLGTGSSSVNFEPGISWGGVSRTPAKIFTAIITAGSPFRFIDGFGFYTSPHAAQSSFVLAAVGASGEMYSIVDSTQTALTGQLWGWAQTYQLAAIIKPVGGEMWIKGGMFTDWTKLFEDTLLTGAVVVPVISFYGITQNDAQVDFAQLTVYNGGSLDDYFTPLPPRNRNVHNVFLIGDSKTVGAWNTPSQMSDDSHAFLEHPVRLATSGWSITDLKNNIVAELAARSIVPEYVNINIGVNGVGIINEATFKADYQTVIDAIHAKWPVAKLYLTRVWARGADATFLTMKTWIDTLVSTNSSFCFQGADENVWLKHTDDGATYTVDGLHYSAAGHLRRCVVDRQAIGL